MAQHGSGTGRDAGGSAIGYGAALDQTFADGMTVNITVDQPMSFVQYQVSNIPPNATALSVFTGPLLAPAVPSDCYWEEY